MTNPYDPPSETGKPHKRSRYSTTPINSNFSSVAWLLFIAAAITAVGIVPFLF